MTVGANSYGAATDVAALTWAWVSDTSGVYTTATLPTLAQVEGWIDQVSAVMNTALSNSGFTIPLTQADSVLAVKSIVAWCVAELANYANSTGRFFTERALASGTSPFQTLRTEINAWVEDNAAGLEQMGAARATTNFGQMAYREFDEAGDTVTPIFQRKAFSNVFDNWDSDGT